LSGIPKSILLTIIDMMIYHTMLSVTQVVGFSIAGAGTYYYSQLTNPPASALSQMKEKTVDPLSDEESQLPDYK
jgi:hypothetical protein